LTGWLSSMLLRSWRSIAAVRSLQFAVFVLLVAGLDRVLDLRVALGADEVGEKELLSDLLELRRVGEVDARFGARRSGRAFAETGEDRLRLSHGGLAFGGLQILILLVRGRW
jgi:hypothetical protein